MRLLFIADLHLAKERPRLVRGFIDLIQHYQNKIDALYILGDWFNVWLGDDDQSDWIQPIIDCMQQLAKHQVAIYFIAGNRDFALGKPFLAQFNAKLLVEPSYIHYQNYTIRIEHGDALCTDDVNYQRFRRIIRQPWLLNTLLSLPISWRQKIALSARKKSNLSNQKKSSEIMDVNALAVSAAMQGNELLIHGHTHRPAIHQYENNKKRIVLGDWRESTGEAMILLLENQLLEPQLLDQQLLNDELVQPQQPIQLTRWTL